MPTSVLRNRLVWVLVLGLLCLPLTHLSVPSVSALNSYSAVALGPLDSFGPPVNPIAINDAGDVIGVSSSGGYLYQDGQTIQLGGIPSDINAHGEVAGYEYGPSTNGFFYSNGITTELSPGYQWSNAIALNDAGQVVGNLGDESGEYVCFVYDHGQLMTFDMGTGHIVATDINNHGQVIGHVYSTVDFSSRFFLYDIETTQLTDLGQGEAYEINDAGKILGRDGSRAFLYDTVSHTKTFLTLPGGTYSEALDMNEVGQIVGVANDGSGNIVPFVYSNGMIENLSLGGPEGAAYDINESGQVVGESMTSDFEFHAFIWENGNITDLHDQMLGGDDSAAWAINDSGIVTGWAETADGTDRAFVYHDGQATTIAGAGSKPVDRFAVEEHLSWSVFPRLINNHGQVIGTSFFTGLGERGFLSSPTANTVPSVSITTNPASPVEGQPLTLSASVNDPDAGDSHTIAWSIVKDATTIVTGTQAQLTFTPEESGTYQVSLIVTDASGAAGSANTTINVAGQAPVITSIDSPMKVWDGSNFPVPVTHIVIPVYGEHFTESAVVYWNDALLETFVSYPEEPGDDGPVVWITIPVEFLAVAGTAVVTMVTENGTSAPYEVVILSEEDYLESLTPALSRIQPLSTPADVQALTLTLIGTNFLSNATASLTNSTTEISVPTTFISETELQVDLPAAVMDQVVAQPGTVEISVTQLGGEVRSNVLPFFVTEPGSSVTEAKTGTIVDGTASVAIPGIHAIAAGQYGTVTVATYDQSGSTSPIFSTPGSYFDLYVGIGSQITAIDVTLCPTESVSGTPTLEWWDGETWQVVQPTPTLDDEGCLVAQLDTTSVPAISDLTGTVFRIPATPPDTVAPTTTATVDGESSTGTDWFTSPVTVTLTVDEDSATQFSINGGDWLTYTSAIGLSQDGIHQVRFFSTDAAGNTEATQTLTLQIDQAAPTGIDVAGNLTAGGTYVFGSVPPMPTCSATDPTSGLASCVVTGYSSLVGSHTLTATATDVAGNEASVTVDYVVRPWTINGFFSPVDGTVTTPTAPIGILNTVKGGSTVPLKFEVFAGSNELTDTSVVVSLTTTLLNAPAGTPTDAIELLASGNTVLRYDMSSGQFHYNWKTPKSTAGKVIRVTVTLLDGSTISADFKLK